MAGGQVIPVVKADAYGHGAVEVTRYLHEHKGVKLFAVATLGEAQELAHEFPEISLLIFTRVFRDELPDLPPNAILTVVSMEHARSLMGTGIPVHLNVNTGMNRLGLSSAEALSILSDKASDLNVRGIYSHFSSSDTASEKRYDLQRERFEIFVSKARELGFDGLVHLSNSAALLHESHDRYDAMRLGIGLYGYDTFPGADHQHMLSPAMEIKAPLMRLDRIHAGETVSYSERWEAIQDTTIGTLRIGYADGYSRSLTNNASASLGGKVYPLIGTVTMDHIMIDLGDDQPEPGTYFTVLGGELAGVRIADVANRINTIPYEICCAVSKRVFRTYITD